MFLTITGKFLVTEIGVELPPGRIMGELGFIDPKNRRTQTVESLEDGDVLTISYDRLLELYFQNPEFGYYFLRLTAERLMQNTARLETTLAEGKAQLEAATAAAGTNPAGAAESSR
jgi:CRP-like cAMP-binding protein